MYPLIEQLLPIGFFLIALLYASVGHGGATGYLALLALAMPALPPQEASTTALILNSLVSGLALVQFARAGHFPVRLALPFLLASIPAAFVGGVLMVPVWLFHLLLLMGLAMAALRLALLRLEQGGAVRPPSFAAAMGIGGAIGLISGIVGIGGGIFLSPLLILLRWATPRDTAGVAASFVLLNSLAGLLARVIKGTLVIGSLQMPMLAAIAGGLLGAYLGAYRLMPTALNRALAMVLLIACIKLALTLL
ncbi:MAG: TSUP family transporter [Fimbriimonadales bacterium]